MAEAKPDLYLIPAEDPRLQQWCPPEADPQSLADLAQAMAGNLEKFHALGLSAPQVGYLRRVFVFRDHQGQVHECVNPHWEPCAGSRVVPQPEGCVSYPEVCLQVPRHWDIWAQWTTPQNLEVRRHLWGIDAQCFQHEWDHLEGRVMFERAGLNREQRRRYRALWTPRTAS